MSNLAVLLLDFLRFMFLHLFEQRLLPEPRLSVQVFLGGADLDDLIHEVFVVALDANLCG